MYSRRELLKLGLMAGINVSLPFKPGTPLSEPLYNLFVDAGDIDRLRELYASAPLFQDLRDAYEAFDIDAEYQFIQDEVRYNDHLFHMRRLTDTASRMAFRFLMTENKAFADLAIATVETIMKFERWDYFLDGDKPIAFQRASRATTAVSLCVDWLGNLISSNTRDAWLQTMALRGCEPCYQATYGMRYPDRVTGWAIDPTSTYFEHRPGDRSWDLSNWPYIFDQNNLKAEPAAALAIGAITYEQFAGSSPDTERWLEQAIHSINGYRTIFSTDGSYNEGISYAGATALHLMQAYSILYRFKNLDLSDQLNWPGFMDYALAMSMPTRSDTAAVINFGDVGNGLPSAVPLWMANHTRDPYALWFAHNRAASHSFWSVVWYPEASSPSASPSSDPDLWVSDLEWIVSRSGHAPDDLVVAMRSGPPFNHEHADRNTIILKCFGEQLVTDPHRPGYSRTDPTWPMRETTGHSGILINGQGHQYVDGSEGTNASNAEARLVRYGVRDGYHYWSSDATQAYQLVLPGVHLVMRTVLVLHEWPAVVLIDRVDHAQPVTIQARFFGYNSDEKGSIASRENGFFTTRPHASLYATAFSPQNVRATNDFLPLPEDIARKYPYAEISTEQPAQKNVMITVLLPTTRSSIPSDCVIEMTSDNRIDLTLHQESQTQRLRIRDRGPIPEYEVDPVAR